VVKMCKVLIEAIRKGNVRQFYKSTDWKRKRKEILQHDNYECQRCKSKGKYHRAETVHHIKHLKDFPELALVDSNLISLCFNCHNEEHPEKLASQAAERRRQVTPERW
jgi:5-methylcytosine-specific restriction endonuclease McrA